MTVSIISRVMTLSLAVAAALIAGITTYDRLAESDVLVMVLSPVRATGGASGQQNTAPTTGKDTSKAAVEHPAGQNPNGLTLDQVRGALMPVKALLP
jgi:hypothetical protein